MSAILAVMTVVLVSPFLAISLLPALREKHENKDDENIVQWPK